MKILSIETATMLGGVAVLDGRKGLIAETRLNVKTTHSERLMTVIDRILKQSDSAPADIDAFAVSIGPGSFTGLRIGLSTAKGLSYATGKPIVTVPTLQAFAWNFPCSCVPVCLMLDARKGEVYSALFEWEKGEFRTLMKETAINPADLVRSLEGVVLFAGEGASLYWGTISGGMQERALMAPPQAMVPSPANVALLGLWKAERGEFAEVSAQAPLYIRKSEAEVKWSEKS